MTSPDHFASLSLTDKVIRIKERLDDDIEPAWRAAGCPGSIAEAFGMSDELFVCWERGGLSDDELVAWWDAEGRVHGERALLRWRQL